MPTTQIRNAIVVGTGHQPGGATLQLNTSLLWLGICFTPSESKTISKVKIYCSAVAGTLDGNDCTLDVYDNSSSSLPGSSLASTATVTTTPTGAQWNEYTGLSLALTAGKIYWLVFKNAAAVQATDNFTLQWFGSSNSASGILGTQDCTAVNSPWGKRHTTDGGTTWAGAGFYGPAGIRIEYSDGSFDGSPVQAQNVSVVGDGVYSARELGTYFTAPGTNTAMKVRGIAMFVVKTGTPTGFPVFKLYSGSTPSLMATSANIGTAVTDLSGNAWHYAYFSSAQTMTGGTIYRVVIAETTQSDASGNRYNGLEVTIENDANSRALTLFGGLQKTYYNGSVWAETNTSFISFALILDTDAPFL